MKKDNFLSKEKNVFRNYVNLFDNNLDCGIYKLKENC